MANTNPNPATRFRLGQSGNPNGRPPKGYSITETLRSMMNEQPELKYTLGKKILEKALDGDIKAIELIWAYMDGRPRQGSNIYIEQDSKSTEEIAAILQKAYEEDDNSVNKIWF